MNECRFTSISKFGRGAARYFYLPVGIGLLIAGACVFISFLAEYDFSLYFSILRFWLQLFVLSLPLAIGLQFVVFAFKANTFESKKYTANEEGIAVYCGRKVFLYKWDEISEMIIAAYAASANLQNYQTVICVFFSPRDVSFLKKILHSYFYGVMNQNKFLVLDFDNTTAVRLSSLSYKTIVDYRKEQGIG